MDGRCWTCADENGDSEKCCNRCPPRSSSSSSCFPSTAMVHLKNEEKVKMTDLRVGDQVQTGTDTFLSITFQHSKKYKVDVKYFKGLQMSDVIPPMFRIQSDHQLVYLSFKNKLHP